MRPAVVIEADPVTNDATGVLQCFEAMSMSALLFQGSDDAFDHAISRIYRLYLEFLPLFFYIFEYRSRNWDYLQREFKI